MATKLMKYGPVIAILLTLAMPVSAQDGTSGAPQAPPSTELPGDAPAPQRDAATSTTSATVVTPEGNAATVTTAVQVPPPVEEPKQIADARDPQAPASAPAPTTPSAPRVEKPKEEPPPAVGNPGTKEAGTKPAENDVPVRAEHTCASGEQVVAESECTEGGKARIAVFDEKGGTVTSKSGPAPGETPVTGGPNLAGAAEGELRAGKGAKDASLLVQTRTIGDDVEATMKAENVGEGGTAKGVASHGRSRKGSASARTPKARARAGCDECAMEEIRRDRPAAPARPDPVVIQRQVAPAPPPPPPRDCSNNRAAQLIERFPDLVEVQHGPAYCVAGSGADWSLNQRPGDTGSTISNTREDWFDTVANPDGTLTTCRVDNSGWLNTLTREDIVDRLFLAGDCGCDWPDHGNPTGDGCPNGKIMVFNPGSCSPTVVVKATRQYEGALSCYGGFTRSWFALRATGSQKWDYAKFSYGDEERDDSVHGPCNEFKHPLAITRTSD